MRKFSTFLHSTIALLISVIMILSAGITPLAISIDGDISGDTVLSAEDLVMIRGALLNGEIDSKYDINGDGSFDARDLVNLKKKIAYYINDEKFVINSVSKVGNAKDITLGQLFSLKDGMTVDTKLVNVEIDTADTDVEYEFVSHNTNWSEVAIDFSGTGLISITIYEYCKPTTIEVEIVNEIKFAVNDSVEGTYGNASIITVGTLFSAVEDYYIDSANVSVTAKTVEGDVSCDIALNTYDWQEGKLEFDGTGKLNLTITEESVPTSVELTIVDADKFDVIVDDPHYVKNTENVILGDIFAELDGVDVDSDKVLVNINKTNEEDLVSWAYTPDTTDWTAGIIDFGGEGQVTVTIEEDSKPTTLAIIVEPIEKFVAKSGVELYEDEILELGDVFNLKENVSVDSAAVVVTTDNGTCTLNKEDWTKGTIIFDTFGTAIVTIKEDSKLATVTVKVLERVPTDKFEIKFPNTDAYLYRVGNGNEVALGSLFQAIEGAEIGTVSVTITPLSEGSNVSGVFTENSDWTKASIKFDGTGPVAVTITDDYYCKELTLNLDVVDAKNTTTAVNATANNVVLLNDCSFGSLEIKNGYTLYGNGFTLTCGSDSVASDFGYSFVTLENGTLDNVQIVCPNFDYAALYKSNLTDDANRSLTDSSGKTRYYNARSAVMVSGNSQVLNSRISGGRAALNIVGGNVVIDNSRIEYGAVASILVGSANSIVLKDSTLVQKPVASTYDNSKTLLGFSVLFICDASGNAAPMTLEGEIVQYAWVNEEYSIYVPEAGQSIIDNVLSKTDYIHSIKYDDGVTRDSVCLGFAYMPESVTSAVNATTITDNRTNKETVPYDYAEISILNGKTYVYSYNNSAGTNDSFKTVADYNPDKYSDIIDVIYSDTAEGLSSAKSYSLDGWIYELNVDLDVASGYKLDFDKLTMKLNGISIDNFKVNGSDAPTSPIVVTAGGTNYILTATVNGTEYTANLKVTGTETSKESPSLVASDYAAGLCVASSYGGTWHGAAPALEGIQIKYWSVAEKQYKTISLSDYTPTTAGKLNGTNTTWTYSPDNGDFTLTLTGGQVHSSNNVYAMPVVCNGKLYFVPSSSNGLVNTGNSARTVPVSYKFEDNNNGTALTFSHTWSIAENKDEQYSYSAFCEGKLTQLTESSSGGGCVTPDTIITLADGSKVRVDSLKGDEQLLVWNLETGKLDSAPIMFVDSDPKAECEVIKLYFSDGTEVKVISEHGFWDYDLNKYVYLDKNASDYIGHTFAKQNGNGLDKVQLINVVIEKEVTTAWSPVTVGHLCYFVNDMLSMPGGVGGLFNIFDVNAETMTYDFEAIEKDIETYGLFTYEELSEYAPGLSEDMFNAAGGKYLKISIGKGNLTMDELIAMIERYSKYI